MKTPAFQVPFSAAVTSICALLALASCNKPVPPKAPAPIKPIVSAATTKAERQTMDALLDFSEPADDKNDQAIAAFKREHPYKDATELLKQEAFLKLLAPILQAAVKDYRFQERVQQSIDLAAQLKEGSNVPGAYRLDLKVDQYTPERTDRLLGTVLSGDPERLIDYVTTEVTEAAIEFNYAGTQDRTKNGIAIEPNKPAPPPSEPAPKDQ